MTIHKLWVRGYRSIKDVALKLDSVNAIVGANGTGKSNLYRALYLLSRAANGELAKAIAEEGGMPSALWAGRRHNSERVRCRSQFGLITFCTNFAVGCGPPRLTTLQCSGSIPM